jgi:putative ABC transport system permease protein
VTRLGLLLRRAVAARWPLVGIALLLAVCSGLAVGVPRELQQVADRTLAHALDSAPDADVLTVSARFTAEPSDKPVGSADLLDILALIRGTLSPTITSKLGEGRVAVEGLRYEVAGKTAEPEPLWMSLQTVYHSDLGDEATVVAGSPVPDPESAASTAAGAPIDIAVSKQTADRFRLRAGQVVTTGRSLGRTGQPQIRVRIAAVFEPKDPSAPIWREVPETLHKRIVVDPVPGGTKTTVVGAAFVLPPSVPAWLALSGTATYEWRWDLRVDKVHTGNVVPLRDALRRLQVTRARVGPADEYGLEVRAPLVDTVGSFQSQWATAVRLAWLALAPVGIVAVLAVVLACAQLAIRRRSELVVMHLRGSGRPTLVGGSAAELGIVAALAVAAGGLAGQLLTPTRPVLSGWLSAVLLGTVALAAAAAAAWAAAREPGATSGRTAGRAGSAGPAKRITRRIRPRVAAEIVLVLATAQAVVAARTGGSDLLAASAPALVALTVAAAWMRAYPWLTRGLARLAVRTRGAVTFVGLARAGTDRSGLGPAALALVVALVGAGYASVLASTVAEGQRLAPWQVIGADLRVEVGATDVPRLAHASDVPGASGAVELHVLRTRLSGSGNEPELRVVTADLAALAQLWSGTPLASWGERLATAAAHPDRADRAVLVGTDASDRGGVSVDVGQDPRTLRPDRADGEIPGFPERGQVLLADTSALPSDATVEHAVLLMRGTASAADVRAALTTADVAGEVTDRRSMARALRDAPLAAGMVRTLRLATVGGLLLAAVALGLALLLSGRTRATSLAYLRTLGMSSRGGLMVALVELAAFVLGVALASAAAGWVAVKLVGAGADLRPLTGGITVASEYDVAELGALAFAVVAVAVAAATATVLSQRRRAPASALRLVEGEI